MITKGRFYTVLLVISALAFVAWVATRLYASHTFNEEVYAHLVNYVRAGTSEVAERDINSAIEALEGRGLTEGQISIFCKDPKKNIGLWYENLIKSREVLRKASQESPSKQAIILEKQRDGLRGNGNNTGIEYPEGISIYPYNKLFFWWSFLSFLVACGSAIRLKRLWDNDEEDDPLIEKRDNTAKA